MRKFHAGAPALALMMAALVTIGCNTREPGETKTALNAEPAAPGTTGTTGTATPAPSTAPAPSTSTEAPSTVPTVSFREVVIPAGTTMTVRLTSAVASDTSRVEQRVDGTLTRDVRIGGVEALGAGSQLRGVVTNAERSGRVKGRANVAFRFDHVSAGGTVYPIKTRTIARQAPATKKRDAATIGIPAAGGAIIGGIIGGKDGAVKGGAIGGAAGTATVLSTRGKEVRLAPGTIVTVRLAAPVTVRIRQ